ncbi:MAG: D-alanine--D-alanine ligase [Acidobacteriia bacterium]|nr:D-alanine--D-alanine ligase [Terriglobia bacterium]
MTRRSKSKQASVAVIYNNTGVDHYEQLRDIDPSTLDFTPVYPLQVATVQEEYHAIVNALKTEGYHVTLLNIEDDLTRLQRLFAHTSPDVIFNLVEMFHSDPQLESAIAALFDLYQIPYTGSAPFALDLCQRKSITKQVLMKQGIATPGYRLLRTPKVPRAHGLLYPLIVKPAQEDASLGVEAGSVVYDYGQLVSRVNLVFESFDPPVLIEEFIPGKELHVAILGNDRPQVLPIIEFDFSDLPEDHPAIITYDVKWNPLDQAYHKVHAICPAQLSKKVEQTVREQALQAYQATFCRDYARIDMRLTESDTPCVLEVNPNPDLTESVSFMESAERAGMSFSQTLGKIVGFALARRKKRRVKPSRGGN